MAKGGYVKRRLSDRDWEEIIKRSVVHGESHSELAREFGVTEGAVRKRVKAIRQDVNEVAHQLVTASNNYAEMVPSQKLLVDDVVAQLRVVSQNLSEAARASTDTSKRLAIIANKQIKKINEQDPLDTMEHLQSISAMTKISNEAAQIGFNLINASNKARPDQTVSDEKEVKKITRTIVDNGS